MAIGQYIIGKYFHDSSPGAWTRGNGKSNIYWEFDTKEKVREYLRSKDICLHNEEVLNKGGFLGRVVDKDKCEHRFYLFLSEKDWDEWYYERIFR